MTWTPFSSPHNYAYCYGELKQSRLGTLSYTTIIIYHHLSSSTFWLEKFSDMYIVGIRSWQQPRSFKCLLWWFTIGIGCRRPGFILPTTLSFIVTYPILKPLRNIKSLILWHTMWLNQWMCGGICTAASLTDSVTLRLTSMTEMGRLVSSWACKWRDEHDFPLLCIPCS